MSNAEIAPQKLHLENPMLQLLRDIRDSLLRIESMLAPARQGNVPAWMPVQSSRINAVRYWTAERQLDVRFKDDSVYRYGDISLFTWQAFYSAESKGKFLDLSIKGHYAYTKLENFNE
jgi:hypothetical protein